MNTWVTANLNAQIDGDTIEETEFNFFDTSDNPLDLSDVTPKVMIRKGGFRGKVVKTCSIGSGLSWNDQSSGRLLLSGVSLDWGHGEAYYDLQFTYATSGAIRTFVRGSFKVEKQSTT